MPHPLIDVLIPIYNAAATLESALQSIQRQTVTNIRILAVDDGSTDGTASLLQRMASEDARVQVVTRPNGGIVDALNLGLSQASAPLIARHDADDLADLDRFAQQLDYLRSHSDCIAVSCFARQIDQAGVALGANAVFPPPQTCDPFWVPSIEPYLLHPFLMVRREAMLRVGGYRHVHHAEDTDLYWRLQEFGRLHVIPRIMGSYRLSAQSIMSRSLLDARISAIHSQLAAIAANRRRSDRGDLQFAKQTAAKMAAAGTSEQIFALAEEGLSVDESAYLRRAYSAKLLELSTYRPYKPDRHDAQFIARALQPAAMPSNPVNRKAVRRMRAIVAATLLRTGEWRAAHALLDIRTLPQATLRLGIQLVARALPLRARRAIRRFRGRWDAFRPEN